MSDESRTISREELYRLVWSKPTRDIAKEFGISDVGLGKICKRLNIPKPPPGYWQRIASGYKGKTPSLPSLGKGQRNEVTIWPSKPRRNSEGKNPALMEVLKREKLADNRIVVSEDLRGSHSLVSYTNKVLSKAKPDSYGRLILAWNTRVERPYLGLRVSKQSLHRSLRIMDALLKAMESRGHKIDSSKGLRLVVNDEKIKFHISEKVKRSERELTSVEKERPWIADRWIFTPTGELTFTIDEVWIERKNWRDSRRKPLEDQLNDIVAGIITAAESIRIKSIEREAAMQRSREAELRRQELERSEQLKKARLQELLSGCASWMRSRDLRMFLQECQTVLSDGKELVSGSCEAHWLTWANNELKTIDPLKNGWLEKIVYSHGQSDEADTIS